MLSFRILVGRASTRVYSLLDSAKARSERGRICPSKVLCACDRGTLRCTDGSSIVRVLLS